MLMSPRSSPTAALALLLLLNINSALAAPSSTVAFVDVTVVPMTREELRLHQTVVVEGGEIVAIGSSDSIRVPRDARKISGASRYLLPGLIDMHVHFRRQPSDSDVAFNRFPDYQQRNDDMGVLFVANGVTSVRQMHGHPVGDALRVRSLRDWLGPAIYSTAPITDGSPPIHPFSRVVTTPADAAGAVAEDKANGYLAVKVYSALSPPVYDALVAAAATAKIDVVGHVPDEVGLEHAIAAHQATIEHVDSFVLSLQPGNGPYVVPPTDATWHDLWERADSSKLTIFADELRRNGIWTCPTVVVSQLSSPDYERSAEMKYIPSAFRAALRSYYSLRPYDEERTFALSLVRRLHERGAGLLLGTDTFVVVPGFSAIQELENFVAAGLTPYEALQTGTINAARALHQQDTVGTIDIGKRADLLLIEGNPLEQVSNVKKVAGVMLRGRWLPEAELQKRLALIADSIKAAGP
jgi:hypothetical protein